MAYTINLPTAGIYLIGNYTNLQVKISETVDSAVSEIKTLKDGIWKSWNKNVSEEFQGISSLDVGRGYIITVTEASSIVFNTDNVANIMDVPVILGENLLTVPYNLSPTGNERFTASSFKSVFNDEWKSWSKDSLDVLQGFSYLERGRGYFTKVLSINQTVRDWVGNAIPIYVKTSELNFTSNGANTLTIILPYKFLNVYEVYLVDFGTIFDGWEYDRVAGSLHFMFDDLELMNQALTKKVIIQGMADVNQVI